MSSNLWWIKITISTDGKHGRLGCSWVLLSVGGEHTPRRWSMVTMGVPPFSQATQPQRLFASRRIIYFFHLLTFVLKNGWLHVLPLGMKINVNSSSTKASCVCWLKETEETGGWLRSVNTHPWSQHPQGPASRKLSSCTAKEDTDSFSWRSAAPELGKRLSKPCRCLQTCLRACIPGVGCGLASGTPGQCSFTTYFIKHFLSTVYYQGCRGDNRTNQLWRGLCGISLKREPRWQRRRCDSVTTVQGKERWGAPGAWERPPWQSSPKLEVHY